MNALETSKCIHHAEREAAARCPECRHYFCRECITEHAGRVICSSCLKKSVDERREKQSAGGLRKLLRRSFAGVYALICLLVLWIFFFTLGQLLLELPADYHSSESRSTF